MRDWSAIYERPRALSRDWAYQRIYAPHAYKRIREASTAPIIISEGAGLAQYYPICWRMDGDKPVLAVLLGLSETEYGRYPAGRTPLPLALQCYPFVVPDEEAIAREQLYVDDVIADRPTDVGAPIVMENGRMSLGAVQRARLALTAGRMAKATETLSHLLLHFGLLEPWPLKFDLGEAGTFARSDLMVLSAARLGDPALFSIIERGGGYTGMILGLHRLSLFRINALIHLARTDRPPAEASVLPGISA